MDNAAFTIHALELGHALGLVHAGRMRNAIGMIHAPCSLLSTLSPKDCFWTIHAMTVGDASRTIHAPRRGDACRTIHATPQGGKEFASLSGQVHLLFRGLDFSPAVWRSILASNSLTSFTMSSSRSTRSIGSTALIAATTSSRRLTGCKAIS